MSDIRQMLQKTHDTFTKYFGVTPLGERLWDIRKEASELCRHTDLNQLRQESGDLLASLLQLFNETGLDPNTVLQECLTKIASRQEQYLSIGRKKRVAMLGGAFDPPHIGHLEAARIVLSECPGEFDEVWLVPCYKHMYNKQMLSFEHRVAMCELMSKADGRIRVFDYEGRNKLGGDTYTFIKMLLADKAYSETHNFSWIIGVDNANTSYQWVNWEHLERMIRFVVIPRKGYSLKTTGKWCLQSPHIYVLSDNHPPEISSTMVRQSFKTNKGEIARNLLTSEVWQYACSLYV